MRQSSIVIRISMALACIVALSVATMLTSYWISDKADNDASAINIAGSLRVQRSRVGILASHTDASPQHAADANTQPMQSWQYPICNSSRNDHLLLHEHNRRTRSECT